MSSSRRTIQVCLFLLHPNQPSDEKESQLKHSFFKTDDYLFFHDLSTVANSGMPQLYANLSKNRTIPSLHGGVLWGDSVNKRVYQFGGEFPGRDLTTPFRGIYAYDILDDQWDFFGLDHVSQPASTVIYRTSYGAGVAIPERGEGYYFGGWISNRSEPNWGATPVATSYLVKYEMDRNLWTNSSGPADRVGRAEGSLVYVPAGDSGMLVYFGGVRDKFGNGTVIEGQPMDEILLYDVLSFKWYTQKASGTIPEMRSRFCSGVAWADDRSSYNMCVFRLLLLAHFRTFFFHSSTNTKKKICRYIYGGAGMPPNTAGFDDIYVLSLPTFTWIKLYPNDTTSSTGEYPHHSLSCNVHLDGSQMLIIGGSFPVSDMCDTPEQWGVHNLDMGRRNSDGAVWQLYDPAKKGYVVPWDIRNVVGGSETGASTKREPENGFSSPDLKTLLARTASAPTRTPTRDVGGDKEGGNKLSTGAIAGIAVGSAVGAIVLLSACIFIIRKRRAAGNKPEMAMSPGGGGGGLGPGPHGYPSPYYEPVSAYPNSPPPHSSHYNQYNLPVPVQSSPIELAASSPHPPTTPGPYEATATPDSTHAKVDHGSWTPDHHRSYSTLQAHSPNPTSPGAYTAYTTSSGYGEAAHELSATPGFERRRERGRDREPGRVHETYYHA